MRKSPSESAFSPFVLTAITTTRPTPARLTDFTGRVIFTAAFFWAWAHGQAGVIAMVGAVIASRKSVAEATTAAAAPWPTAAAMRAAAEKIVAEPGPRPGAAAEVKCMAAHQPLLLEQPVPLQHTPHQPVQHLARQPLVPAPRTPPLRPVAAVEATQAVARRMVAAAADMKAADTSNRQLWHRKADISPGGGASRLCRFAFTIESFKLPNLDSGKPSPNDSAPACWR